MEITVEKVTELREWVDYEININTMAILPAKHLVYQSIVIEPSGRYYVKETVKQLLTRACLEGGSTYEGRKIAVIHHFHYEQKTPIPVDPNQSIYAFPTESPTQIECCWIFYSHVRRIIPRNNECTIEFKNKTTLDVRVSEHQIRKQRERAGNCMSHFSNRFVIIK
ncbi:competence protein ComK [Pseudalkalibacillus caeni]|uniref:Competence protein n=1 Tax=Exobacillus caeni TaxID=2574798 RepID=A0A5R9FA51_9BACL|nr:competence protein ComK [Pseudalkalibacillus caeni]TLS36535.1 competence protein [Pseudalkalibacillus caeni]